MLQITQGESRTSIHAAFASEQQKEELKTLLSRPQNLQICYLTRKMLLCRDDQVKVFDIYKGYYIYQIFSQGSLQNEEEIRMKGGLVAEARLEDFRKKPQTKKFRPSRN